MPELPDVAVFKRYLNRTALHKKIATTRIFDDYVIKEVTPRTIQRRLKDHRFETSRRRGKHLFVQMDSDNGWLALHFGMTGYLDYFKRQDDMPEHTRIRFDFDNGFHLAFVCQRKFGEVRVINDLDRFIEEHDIGPDALDADFELLESRVGGRQGAIKSTLMNQKVLAGLGNVYTDEILFQARVHPKTPVSELKVAGMRSVFNAMEDVLEKAIDAEGDPDNMPPGFLLPHRTEGADCPRCGGKIKKVEVNRRSTYLCPRCQEKK